MIRVKQHLLLSLLLLLVVATLHGQGVDEFDFYKTEDAIQGLQSIAAGPKGVWAVASDGSVHYRVGSHTGRWVIRFGNSWKTISDSRSVLGEHQCWGVDRAGNVYYRTGTRLQLGEEGTGWEQVSGAPMKQVLTGALREVFGIDDQGVVHVRQGSDPDHLAGTHWLEAPAEFQGLKALDVFYYYAVGLKRDSNDAVFIHWY